MDTTTLCQKYLNLLYHDVPQHSSSEPNETPGEILFSGVSKFLSKINLTSEDTFIDLGAGLGKIVLQIFLTTTVKEACGIEISPSLAEKAQLVAKKVQLDLPEFFTPERKLSFTHGNFLEIPFNATVALVNGVCFNQTLVNAVGKILEQSVNIHTVLAMRPLPTLTRLKLNKVLRLECSWDTALGYIYH